MILAGSTPALMYKYQHKPQLGVKPGNGVSIRPPSPSPKNAVVHDLSELSVSECACVRLCDAHMAYTYSAPNKESTFSEILISAVKSTFSHSNHHKSIKELLDKFSQNFFSLHI